MNGRAQSGRAGVLDFIPPRGYIGYIYSLSDQPSGLRRGFVFWGQESHAVPSGGWVHAVLFSQDQDLSEVADEVRAISIAQGRWIKVASAFPVSPTYTNTPGVNKTDWVRFDRALYDRCIDRTDYRKGFKP